MAILKTLDPVQGLVDYVLDIKPYHTKIVEVLVEYVHAEAVDVTIIDEHALELCIQNPPGFFDVSGILQPGSLLDPSALFKYECDTGWDTSGFGSGQLLITSPNPDIPLHTFPAINPGSNTFTINGNVSTDIKPGDVVYINSVIEDITNIYNVFSINSGAAGSASFVVIGDVTSIFVPGYSFSAVNADGNNGTYTVESPVGSSFDGTYTTIPVDQSISSGITGGTIGLVVTSGVHNGYYTVANVEFNQGSIDYQTIPSNPLSLLLGNNPHTVITVLETLPAIPVLTLPDEWGVNHSYVATVILDPIEVETALSYSRSEKLYNPGTGDVVQIPNEGINRTPILGITLSTVVGGIPIPDSGKVVIEGDFRTSNVFIGDAINISSSTDNNGTYTITSITYDAGQDETTFGVVELIDDPTVDGFGTVTIPSNVFFVAGDRTSQFTQGRQFDMFGGSFESTYTILRSDFTQGKTRVRTAETIFDIGAGNTIVGTTGGFVVPGNQTGVYAAGVSFYVTGSPQNNGPYVVDVGGTTFDVGTGLSTVPVVDTIDSTPGGELHLAVHGSFKQHRYGYDENSPLCGMVPDTIVAVHFNEQIKFTGIGIELHDDLIAYNLENTDPGGFEFPLNTIVDDLTPPIVFNLLPPVGPAVLDLWYDQTSDIFRQWSGSEWKTIKTANWFDTDDNILHYRTIDKFVDTGWILDSFRFPGYNDLIPAVSETIEIGDDLFTSNAISPGVAETSFTLTTSVPGSDETLLKVTVNNIPAGFTLTSATDFTITSPPVVIGDIVEAFVYDRTGPETNAHVTPFDVQPHMVLHRTVTVDNINGAYIVAGGNFIDRFIPFNNFTVFDTTIPNANLGVQNTTSFPVVDVDDSAGTITVDGNYEWLYAVDRIFRVNPSDRNYNDFEVQSSVHDPITDTTAISVIPFPYESKNDDTDVTQQYFYNPPLPILTIDNVSDSFNLPGKVFESFPNGIEVFIEGSTVGNNLVWTVASTSYDSINDITTVFVTGDIPDQDITSGSTIRTPIFQNYSKDLGVIIGAIFEPTVAGTGAYDTNQPKTIVVPTTPILSIDANAIEYTWVGPVRFDVAMREVGVLSAVVGDNLHVDNEILGGAFSTEILDTDSTANTFTVHQDDPVNLIPIDLTDRFTPGAIFSVINSFGPIDKSNDAMYVVESAVWDYVPAVWDSTGHPNYDPILITPAAGTGDTIITIDTNFNNIPPYNSFTVVAVSNNGGSLPTMTLSGDHVNLFDNFVNPVFRLNEPIIDLTPLENVMAVSNIELVGGNTVLTVDNDFIDEAFTGPIGIIEAVYRGNIYFDEVAVSGWVHGDISIQGTSSATLTATTFTDDLMFGWGDVIRWDIVDANEANSSVDIQGDFTAVIDPNDRVSIVGSQNIDGDYEAVSVTYSVGTDISTVVLANPILPAPGTTLFGQLEMDGIDITPWFQYNIIEIRSVSSDLHVDGDVTGDVFSGQEIRILGTNFNNAIVTASGAPTFDAVTNTSTIPVMEPLNPGTNPIVELPTNDTIKTQGSAAMYLQGGNIITVVNSTGNDNSYIVEGVTFDGVFSFITITTTFPNTTADGDVEFNERGGWIESLRYQGIALRFEDLLHSNISENADAALLLSSGSLVDAWDYSYFDVGGFDEELGTLIHLYSNTF